MWGWFVREVGVVGGEYVGFRVWEEVGLVFGGCGGEDR